MKDDILFRFIDCLVVAPDALAALDYLTAYLLDPDDPGHAGLDQYVADKVSAHDNMGHVREMPVMGPAAAYLQAIMPDELVDLPVGLISVRKFAGFDHRLDGIQLPPGFHMTVTAPAAAWALVAPTGWTYQEDW